MWDAVTESFGFKILRHLSSIENAELNTAFMMPRNSKVQENEPELKFSLKSHNLLLSRLFHSFLCESNSGSFRRNTCFAVFPLRQHIYDRWSRMPWWRRRPDRRFPSSCSP